VSCSVTPKDLQRAEQLMESTPDSALHILQHISPSNYMSDSDKALYGLLMFQAQDKNYLPLSPDTLINYAIDYYERKGPQSRLAAAYLYKARMYKYALQYEDATICLMKALDNADKTTDFALLGRVYSDLGTISYIQHDYVDARSEYKQEYYYFSKTTLKKHTLEALLAIGRTYFVVKDHDSASIYYKQALHRATDSISKGNCMQEIAQNYYAQENYDSALHYLHPLIHYPYTDTNRAMRYFVLADVYLDIKQLDSAYFYAKRAFQFKPCIIIRQGCYRILGNTTFLQNKTKEMAHYLSLYTASMDSVKRIESQTKVSVLKKMNQADKKIKADEISIIFLAIILLLIIVVGIIIIYCIHKKYCSHKQTQEVRMQQVHSKLMEKQTNLVENLKLKIEKGKSKQASIRKKASQTERDALVLELYQSTLHLNDWEEFTRLMNYTFNNIVCTLANSCPDIKKNEISWCCLHLLNVPQDERIIVLNTSTASMYKLKQRLAIKLQLNGAKMLDEYLKQFKEV
jgi:tetratricopeptide (TPR) repeat protein